MKLKYLLSAGAIMAIPQIAHAGIIKSLSCVNNACAVESSDNIQYRVATETQNNTQLVILDILNIDGKSKSVPQSVFMKSKQVDYVQTAEHYNKHFFRIVFMTKPGVKYSISKSNQYLSIIFPSSNADETQPNQNNTALTPNTSNATSTNNPLIQPLTENNQQNVQVVQYLPNQTVNIGLISGRTVQVILPAHISKLITGINTQKISAEVADNQLFLKPLDNNVSGDLYIICVNGITYHLHISITSQAPLVTQVVNAVTKKQSIETVTDNNTIAQFLIQVRNHSDSLDVSVIKNPKVSDLTPDVTLKLIKMFQGTQYTAYEGIIQNISKVRIRVPYEKIYFKDLLGVAADDMYLNPNQESKIWFIVSHTSGGLQ